MISVCGHTAKNVVTQIGGREWAEEIGSEPATDVSRKYESSRGQTEFSPQPVLPWKWKQHVHSNRRCTLGQHYECCSLRYSYTATPLCTYKASYRKKCTFTFNTVPFPAGHYTVRSASIMLFLTSHPGVLPKYLQSLRYVVCGATHLGGLDAERFLKRAPANTEILQGSMRPLL